MRACPLSEGKNLTSDLPKWRNPLILTLESLRLLANSWATPIIFTQQSVSPNLSLDLCFFIKSWATLSNSWATPAINNLCSLSLFGAECWCEFWERLSPRERGSEAGMCERESANSACVWGERVSGRKGRQCLLMSLTKVADYLSEEHEGKIWCIAGMNQKYTLSFHPVCGRSLSSCLVLKNSLVNA